MAQLDTGGGDGGGKKGKHQKKRAKKASTHIDMTPMVDLAFLLLTFFMLTTTFSKPKTLEINMPAKVEDPEKQPPVSNVLTLLLKGDDKKKDKIYWYYNALKEDTKFESTNLSSDGLRKLLLDKNVYATERLKKLEEELKAQKLSEDSLQAKYKRGRQEIYATQKALTVLLKSDDKAKYKTVVDILDELKITDVGRFAIVDMDSMEVEILKTF
jgi:biopolymer transport protein ExbD